MQQHENHSLGHIAALATVIVWGTTFVSTKVLLRSFDPVEVLFTRFAIGLVILFLMNHKRLQLLDKKHELYFIGAGISGVTLYFLFENIALTYSTASNVGILLACAPFFTGLVSKIFLKDHLGKSFFIGFLFAIAGILLINFNGNVVLQLNPIGDILAIVAALIWAFYCMFIRKIGEYEYNTVQVTRRVFCWGILFMIPVVLWNGYDTTTEEFFRLENIGNFLYLGIGACAICFVTWNFAMRVLGSVKASVYLYLNPVITIIASAIILKERITMIAIAGTVLIFIGLVVSEKGNKKAQEELKIHGSEVAEG
ncbi:MAG TPA: DMT family transporter [Candidatus Scybalomonas excrementigallinarum]|nr:DMT family transporter [Candidatus Scybalomonas excrementigallinarum]